MGCLGAQVVSSAPAWAHDSLVASDPKDGAVLDRAPSAIVLRFDQPVGRRFGQVVVSGPDGSTYQDGQVQVSGSTVRQALRALGPAGTYRIAWRVVSADGHPVSDTLAFRLASAGAGAGATPTTTPGTTSDSTPSVTASATSPAAGGDTGSGGSGLPWTPIVLVVVLVGLLAAGIGVMARRGRKTSR
nr:copper resistance CopC family protein [Actinopolymorpha pittospori]